MCARIQGYRSKEWCGIIMAQLFFWQITVEGSLTRILKWSEIHKKVKPHKLFPHNTHTDACRVNKLRHTIKQDFSSPCLSEISQIVFYFHVTLEAFGFCCGCVAKWIRSNCLAASIPITRLHVPIKYVMHSFTIFIKMIFLFSTWFEIKWSVKCILI